MCAAHNLIELIKWPSDFHILYQSRFCVLRFSTLVCATKNCMHVLRDHGLSFARLLTVNALHLAFGCIPFFSLLFNFNVLSIDRQQIIWLWFRFSTAKKRIKSVSTHANIAQYVTKWKYLCLADANTPILVHKQRYEWWKLIIRWLHVRNHRMILLTVATLPTALHWTLQRLQNFAFRRFTIPIYRWCTIVHEHFAREWTWLWKCVNCSINGYQAFHICIILVWLSFVYTRAGSCARLQIFVSPFDEHLKRENVFFFFLL